jgi:hypothetical protein
VGFLDAVMTDDSDTIVFGTTCVICLYVYYLCSLFNDTMLTSNLSYRSLDFCKTGQVTVYHTKKITKMGFDTAALVFIALLVGGD